MNINFNIALSKNGDHVKLRKFSDRVDIYKLTADQIDKELHLPPAFKVCLKQIIRCNTRRDVLASLKALKPLIAQYQNSIDHHQKPKLDTFVISEKNNIQLSFSHRNNSRYNHAGTVIFGCIPYARAHECTLDDMIAFIERYEKSVCNKVHIIFEYKSDLAGHSTVYSSGRLFEETRALLSGKRKFFANFRAWWNNDGYLFADTRALLNGKRPFYANTRSFFSKKVVESEIVEQQHHRFK